jgi:hypothetical protein
MSWSERMIKKRFGLGLLGGLLLWPLVAILPGVQSLAVNGLLLDRYSQLAYFTVTNVVAFFFSVSILRLLGSRNPGGCCSRFIAGEGDRPWGRRRIFWVVLASLFAPVFIASIFGTEFPGTVFSRFWRTTLTIGAGAVFGVTGL